MRVHSTASFLLAGALTLGAVGLSAPAALAATGTTASRTTPAPHAPRPDTVTPAERAVRLLVADVLRSPDHRVPAERAVRHGARIDRALTAPAPRTRSGHTATTKDVDPEKIQSAVDKLVEGATSGDLKGLVTAITDLLKVSGGTGGDLGNLTGSSTGAAEQPADSTGTTADAGGGPLQGVLGGDGGLLGGVLGSGSGGGGGLLGGLLGGPGAQDRSTPQDYVRTLPDFSARTPAAQRTQRTQGAQQPNVSVLPEGVRVGGVLVGSYGPSHDVRLGGDAG